jgi:hypothetical protein
MNDKFESILEKVNVASSDNGKEFTALTRKNNIKKLLKDSKYRIISENGLSLIYAKKNYDHTNPFIVISNHIDSLYPDHFCKKIDSSQLLGTFDNSICNAIVIDLMLKDAIGDSAVIAFTGAEERKSCKGAVDTFNYFKNNGGLPEMIITLDVTNLGYKNESFTIENYHARKKNLNHQLKYKNNKDFLAHLKKILPDQCLTKENAWPDETHYYAKKDLNCLSFCLPTARYKTLINWMHSPKGILVKQRSIAEYSRALKKLVTNYL